MDPPSFSANHRCGVRTHGASSSLHLLSLLQLCEAFHTVYLAPRICFLRWSGGSIGCNRSTSYTSTCCHVYSSKPATAAASSRWKHGLNMLFADRSILGRKRPTAQTHHRRAFQMKSVNLSGEILRVRLPPKPRAAMNDARVRLPLCAKQDSSRVVDGD